MMVMDEAVQAPAEVIAAIDIGTTVVKGVLIDRNGRICSEMSVPLETWRNDALWVEQDAAAWWEAVVHIGKAWEASGAGGSRIRCIVFSGQMQDLIAIDEAGQALRPAILYSDGRAQEQADHVMERLSAEEIRAKTGNHFDGTFPLAKILWLREHEPQTYSQMKVVLFGSKDVAIYRLTGQAVTDPTTGATTGLMNIRSRQWENEWLEPLELSETMLPKLLASTEVAGHVLPAAASESGFPAGTPVLTGVGDAGASTLGAGVLEEGELYTYLGTTGWVAAYVQEPVDAADGLFHLAHPSDDGYIATAPILSAGSVHQWAVQVFAGEASRYEEFELLAAESSRARNPLLFLPYLGGERCPVQDPYATGAYLGLTAATTRSDMAAAALEGMSMAIRQVRDLLLAGSIPEEMLVVGGGGNSAIWMQILSDVCASRTLIPDNAQFLPALGAASLGFVHLGWSSDFKQFRAAHLRSPAYEHYSPDHILSEHYAGKYEKYCRLYSAVKPLM